MSREVILYIAASLDGFVADKNNTVDFLHEPDYEFDGEDHGFHKMYNGCDTLFMGNNTMKAVLGFDVPFPYEGKTVYVVTRNPDDYEHEKVTYISNWQEKIDELRATDGPNIWLIGGGQLNASFLAANEIDRVIITVIPCVLGEGSQLFPGYDGLKKFNLIRTESYKNGMVQLEYVPKPTQE